MLHLLAFALLTSWAVAAAESFTGSLTAEQKRKLGLDQLTPAKLAELDAAIDSYRKSGETIAVKKAAESAVAEYKKKEEPGVITRALEIFKRKVDEEREERITAVVQGKFSGWSGRTVFHLDNGQVWQQARPDSYHTKAVENVAVVIYKSPNGYFRLRVLDDTGAWVTVKRVQ